ncbi:LSU ribosomal protein L9P [Saccharicrinis carchari]|uniref:Large ribosomal subunit protein bL9 n=1 Tax=Saccharicrinis carchari TaxID=1168039 RepID=A0A521CXK8_SACCC|nr:50S ribosomal protein L9 [Saccharicrinis carchari]SMO64196.1 LSU ribosomal protein L9P [Saccharicrinis carchari]
MDVILKDDVANIGHKNDVVRVKNGYGRNYLLPKGLAILATPSAMKVHEENMRQRAHKEEKIKNNALEMATKMEGLTLTVGAKTSTTGKIFGSVNTIQIAEALEKAGYSVERKHISIKEDQVKEIGSYVATVKLHREVKVEVNFDVVAE